jgi:hypothetical protein
VEGQCFSSRLSPHCTTSSSRASPADRFRRKPPTQDPCAAARAPRGGPRAVQAAHSALRFPLVSPIMLGTSGAAWGNVYSFALDSLVPRDRAVTLLGTSKSGASAGAVVRGDPQDTPRSRQNMSKQGGKPMKSCKQSFPELSTIPLGMLRQRSAAINPLANLARSPPRR